MYFEASLPRFYEELVYIYIIYLKNRGLYKEMNITLWENQYNRHFSIKYYKVFEYLAYVQILKKKKNKLINKK